MTPENTSRPPRGPDLTPAQIQRRMAKIAQAMRVIMRQELSCRVEQYEP